MGLYKINDLGHLNRILDQTFDVGMHKALQGRWGSRDFVLTDKNTTMNVKMKDLVKTFQTLAAKNPNDSHLINEISKKIIDLDALGDFELRQRGSYSMIARDVLKGPFSKSHINEIDTLRKKYLYEGKIDSNLFNILVSLLNSDGTVNDEEVGKLFKAPYYVEGEFTENTKLTINYLMNRQENQQDILNLILILNYPSKDIKTKIRSSTKSFIQMLNTQYSLRYDRKAHLDEIEKIDSTIKSIDLVALHQKNPEDFAEKYFEGFSEEPHYRDALKRLVQEKPEKAFPMLVKLTASKTVPGLGDEELVCQKLYVDCKELLLSKLKEYGGKYDLNAESEKITFHFDKPLSKKELNKFFDLKTGCTISEKQEKTTVCLNFDGLSKILGIDQSLIETIFSKKYWEPKKRY